MNKMKDGRLILSNGDYIDVICLDACYMDICVKMETMDEYIIIDNSQVLDAECVFDIDIEEPVYFLLNGKKKDWFKFNPKSIVYYS